ncbi:MAG TPA: hypothetical protein VLC95_10910, partial [Anaerolineae bacterium]|nr:hypothetical protein [Anaerolineae bacterium]
MPTQLLATKLYVPPLRAESVARRRLLDRLDAGLMHKLVLISAPAGFGKTTLLSEWRASQHGTDMPFAWVLLDEQDNDPVRFWSYVLAAVEKARPGAGANAGTLLYTLPPPGATPGDLRAQLQVIVTALVNDLVSAQERAGTLPLVVILDDYHTIHAPPVHDSLAFFLDYLPPAVHLVILTRADPPLPLARLRARDQLIELRAADLRFTAGEVEVFLNRVMALNLSTDAVAALDARTEGWAAGLHLAALSLQGLDPAQAQHFVKAFAGTHRHVLSYLTEDVLLRQPEAVQTFLLHTAILPYLTAPLCDAVTGRRDSEQMLEGLANDNLFITPLDAEGQWYRYHPLFADTLRARLQQSSPDLLPVLHLRASAWHQKRGAISDAVRHALAADDPSRAAQLVEDGYKRLVMRGELVTLQRWLDSLPRSLIQTQPKLALAYALALAYSGHYVEVEDRLAQAEKAMAAAGEVSGHDPVRGEIAVIRAVLASVKWDGQCSLELSKQALELLPAARSDEEVWLRVLALQAHANCARLQGRVREAEAYYFEALTAVQTLDSPFLVQAITNRLGQNQLHQGRLGRAAHTFEGALAEAEARGGELWWFSGELYAHLSQIYVEWNDLDRALEHVRRGIDLSRQAHNHLALLDGHLALAGVEAARGQVDAARSALEQAQQLALEVGTAYLEQQVVAHRVWFSLSQAGSGTPDAGVLQWADEWAGRRVQAMDEGFPLILCEFQDLLLARVWMTQGRHDEAITLLTEIESAAEKAGRMAAVIQALVLRARAFEQQGDVGRAKDALVRALILAEPEGYVRTFQDVRFALYDLRLTIDGGPPRSRALMAYLDRLLEAWPDPRSPRTGTQE